MGRHTVAAIALVPLVPLALLAGCGPPNDGWQWNAVEGSLCANGTPTGFGTRDGTSDDLLIYLMGGGACWDAATCYTLKLAWNIDGYDENVFAKEQLRGADIFDLLPDARQVF